MNQLLELKSMQHCFHFYKYYTFFHCFYLQLSNCVICSFLFFHFSIVTTLKKMSIFIGAAAAASTAAIAVAASAAVWSRLTSSNNPDTENDLTIQPDRIADTANPNSIQLSAVSVYSKSKLLKNSNTKQQSSSGPFVASLNEIVTTKQSLKPATARQLRPRLDYSNNTLPLTGHAAILQELQKTLIKRQLIY
jgi:hypothetical protein